MNNASLHVCETWSLTFRKVHSLNMCEIRELRNIFGSKKDEVMAGCRRRHKKGLYDLYCSPNIIRVIQSRKMRWEGHVVRMGR